MKTLAVVIITGVTQVAIVYSGSFILQMFPFLLRLLYYQGLRRALLS
jgi:hypothetical protein